MSGHNANARANIRKAFLLSQDEAELLLEGLARVESSLPSYDDAQVADRDEERIAELRETLTTRWPT